MGRQQDQVDILVVGGGVNGAGIAADASRRGLSVLLCEKGDLASATSSGSSKLIHGGIRYLEHYEFSLVAKALAEREVLMHAAPHIIWPMRFRLPHLPSLRPAWMIRIGLFLYDHLARRKALPGSKGIKFGADSPLKADIKRGFEYSDCWVDDARLVVLNAMAARENGAEILTRTKCINAKREGKFWRAQLRDEENGAERTVTARVLINATGPWVQDFIESELQEASPKHIRLVKGSHIVVPRLYDGEHCYILQNDDGRIVFAIPYENEFTLIGTTDVEIHGDPGKAVPSDEEKSYLITLINRYFKKQLDPQDIIWSYSGVRPLLEDEANNPSAVTRDYYLHFEGGAAQPGLLSAFGGKITTYRKLAEQAVDHLDDIFPNLKPSTTKAACLPGGDFDTQVHLLASYSAAYPWMDKDILQRYVRSYGTLTTHILDGKTNLQDMGEDFGGSLMQAEVDYLMREEWARTAEDILWRRSKRGLFTTTEQQEKLKAYCLEMSRARNIA